jgi:hypothetical protein
MPQDGFGLTVLLREAEINRPIANRAPQSEQRDDTAPALNDGNARRHILVDRVPPDFRLQPIGSDFA